MSKAAGILNGAFGRAALLSIDRPVQRHVHPHAHLLFKTGGANSWFRVGERLLPLAEDTAILVNPWEVHDYPYTKATPRPVILALYIEPEWLAGIDNSFRVNTAPGFFPQACVTVPKRLAQLLHDTADALLHDIALSRAHEELLAAVMCDVIERFSDWRWLRSSPASGIGIARDFRVRRAIEFMTEHIGEPQAMDRIATVSALSRAHFFDLFKSNTGMSPLLFFHALRMEASYKALLGGSASLANIAARLKFSAPGHFTRFFRNHVGVTPSEFRRAMLASSDT